MYCFFVHFSKVWDIHKMICYGVEEIIHKKGKDQMLLFMVLYSLLMYYDDDDLKSLCSNRLNTTCFRSFFIRIILNSCAIKRFSKNQIRIKSISNKDFLFVHICFIQYKIKYVRINLHSLLLCLVFFPVWSITIMFYCHFMFAMKQKKK